MVTESPAGLQARLTQPDTVAYVSEVLSERLAAAMHDRPKRRTALEQQRASAQKGLANLVRALEHGDAPLPVLEQIRARQAEVDGLEQALAGLQEPVEERMAVFPTWVHQQLSDLAGVLHEDTPRVREHFRGLNLDFTFSPVFDAGRPFLRAAVNADFVPAGLDRYFQSAVSGRSHQQSEQ
jgi:hypothetical protein